MVYSYDRRAHLDVLKIKQEPAMCGPTCLRAVMLYFGKDVNVDELARLSGWTKQYGAPPEGLVAAARSFGFRAFTWAEADLDQLARLVKQGVPSIVEWFSVDEGHYSVVVGFDEAGIRIMDPFYGMDRSIKTESFMRRWFDFRDTTRQEGFLHRRVILVLPPEM